MSEYRGRNTRARGKINNSRGQYPNTPNRNNSDTNNTINNSQPSPAPRRHVVTHTPPQRSPPNQNINQGQNMSKQGESQEQKQVPSVVEDQIHQNTSQISLAPNQNQLAVDQVPNLGNVELPQCSNNPPLHISIPNNNSNTPPISKVYKSDNIDVQTLASAFERIIEASNKTVITEMKAIRDTLTQKLDLINTLPNGEPVQTANIPNSNRVDFEQFMNNVSFSTQNRIPLSQQTSGALTFASNVNCKIEKWKISFDGSENVHDFWFKVETLKERSQCSWDHVLANFHVLLKGKAESWFWFFLKKNPSASYDSLKYSIIKEFSRTENEYDKILRMVSRRQGFRETFDDFYTENH